MTLPVALSVNVNKIALLRNSRPGHNPDPVNFARRCLELGAKGVTVHPRPDQRHIRHEDVTRLAGLRRDFPGTEFNIEGNPFAPPRPGYLGLIELVRLCRPDQCTLVPDSDQQLTSDHGFDLSGSHDQLTALVQEIRSLGTRVSLFMDADPAQIEKVPNTGADRIELYTGPYAEAFARNNAAEEWNAHCSAANAAHSLGLGINAGHDLNQHNLVQYAKLPHLMEVSIGHALTIDSLYQGVDACVRHYLDLLD